MEQQNFIDDAERRRVGTDAESERDDGSEGEAGGATQRPDGEAEVTEDFDGLDQHVVSIAGQLAFLNGVFGMNADIAPG